jgi:restriction system protein
MAIPDFQTIMLPLLECLGDRRERTTRDVAEQLAGRFGLTDEELLMRLPSGQQGVFVNRVAWSKSHLKMAGLIENPSRGIVRISDLGVGVLREAPAVVNVGFLKRYPAYLASISKSGAQEETRTDAVQMENESRTPRELIESAFLTLRQATADDLLAKLKGCSPGFFESVVVKLLMAMGYGGVAGDGAVTGKSGDGGIDGLIKQAKRWDGPVGRPVVQGFVGSMDYVRARKGVIMTTSSFTKDALDFVHRIEGKKVVLIDGERLAELMIEHGLGVTTTKTYELKDVSNDFFDEDEG